MENTNKNNMAPCGMNCALCHSFQAPKKNCPGCRSKTGQVRKSCANCTILRCEKKTDYCFECEEYPCKRLKSLDERYRNRYNMSMLENLEEIKREGEAPFLSRQKEKYSCPDCGQLRTVHDDQCIRCKQIGQQKRTTE